MKNQFTIGQMSKLYDIPVKTLRYYDEIGLFTPYHTDGVTGYRYYRAEQFQQLDMISFLKDLGVPLKEIKQKMEHSTLDQFLHTLEKYEETTRRKMNELQTTHRHLTQKIQQLQLAKTTERGPMLSSLPKRSIWKEERSFSSLGDMEVLLREIKKTVNHMTPIMVGSVGLFVSPDHISGEEAFAYDGLYILLEDAESGYDTLPEGTYATVYSVEDRRKDSFYYNELVKFVSGLGLETEGPLYTRQIVDSFISHMKDERLIEYQIKVRD
ncbi:MerR family transcriptional regulator [Rossellomorea sp. FS2]|uniref:MerR family transcriptional regulator n=1 Tax=Rossellomorea TaxID=2837508 RepID=UPI003A4DF5E6